MRRRRTQVEFPREQGEDQNRRSRTRLFAEVATERYSRFLPAVCVGVDQTARSGIGISDADVRRFRGKRFSTFNCVLPNARPLSRLHVSQRHLHAAWTRLWWRLKNARKFALLSQPGFLRRQRSHFWTSR